MKKLFIDKNDEVGAILERVAATPDNEIVLVIPRGSQIKESVAHLRRLKRDCDMSSKTLIIESVDEEVLALAHHVGIEAIHPLLQSNKRAFSDIVVPQHPLTKKEEKIRQEHEERIEEEGVKVPVAEKPHKIRVRGHRSKLTFVVIAVVVIGVLGWVATTVFGKATVAIELQSIPWSFERTITADKSLASVAVQNGTIPAELFTQRKNFTQEFSATQTQEVKDKAKGMITIYNEFDGEKQSLVATTRFQTADGKIFRLVKPATVPGMGSDGKAGTIEAEVVADQAGAEYNIATQQRLAVPGFSGTPRFEKFYGIVKSTSGGFIGSRGVPAKAELEQASDQVKKILSDSLQDPALSNRPEGLVVLPEASRITFGDIQEAAAGSGTTGKFSIYGEAQLQALAFKETDIEEMAVQAFAQEHADRNIVWYIQDPKIEYQQVAPDFDGGKVTIKVLVTGTMKPKFDQERFAGNIQGKTLRDAQGIAQTIQGLSSVKLSVWPIWLFTVPENREKIDITVR